MAKQKVDETQAAVPQPPVAAPAPVQAAPQYYQPVAYAQAPPKQAKHPALELALALVSVLASAWLAVDAIASSISLFGNKVPSFDTVTTFFVGYTSGFTGVIITALGSLVFAGLAFWLFRRLSAAIESEAYKGALHAATAVAALKTTILGASTVAVGLTPLLTLQKGSDVGPIYLYQFLPLLLGTAVFGFVTWYLLKLSDKQQVGKLLSSVLLALSAAVFVLGLVAVIVKSHSDDYRPYNSSNYSSTTPTTPSVDSSTKKKEDSSSSSTKKDDSTSTDKKSSGGSSTGGKTFTQCYDDYTKTRDYDAYSTCLDDVLDTY